MLIYGEYYEQVYYPRSRALRIHRLQYEIRTEFRHASDERTRSGNIEYLHPLIVSRNEG